jgi:hypothetical protein
LFRELLARSERVERGRDRRVKGNDGRNGGVSYARKGEAQLDIGKSEKRLKLGGGLLCQIGLNEVYSEKPTACLYEFVI